MQIPIDGHPHESIHAMTPEQKKKNRQLGLILATVALVFFGGFMLRLVLLKH